jgi:DDE superfamily endonuclease
VLSNPQKEILYLSYCWVGTAQDYAMFKVEFPPGLNWFKDHRVRVDLGFMGIEKDYQEFKELFVPHKKKKKQELNMEQKETNRLLASKRIVVEHAIGGLKRYRILSDRLRMRNVELYNVTLGVCAGLWNFHLTH